MAVCRFSCTEKMKGSVLLRLWERYVVGFFIFIIIIVIIVLLLTLWGVRFPRRRVGAMVDS